MAAPVLAGIPLVYEMLVGAGILAGGAVTANKMQKEIQKTIDTNPGVIDEALKNIFLNHWLLQCLQDSKIKHFLHQHQDKVQTQRQKHFQHKNRNNKI
jgi:hypothetical protein